MSYKKRLHSTVKTAVDIAGKKGKSCKPFKMCLNLVNYFKRLVTPEKVKLFQIGALAPNKLDPEGSKLRLQIHGVELWLRLGSKFAGASHIFTFIE